MIEQGPEFAVTPVVSWPREANAGRSYVVTVDLRRTDPGAEWPYEHEEFVVGCMLDGQPVCTVRALGDPGVVLHRFGGTYGPARFVADFPPHYTPVPGAALWLTLTTAGGVPFYTGRLPLIDSIAAPPESIAPVSPSVLPQPVPGGPEPTLRAHVEHAARDESTLDYNDRLQELPYRRELTEPPFRAEHVGSLLRPRELVGARREFVARRIGADRLRAAEDDAIRDVVALQEDLGFRVATDGEFRRTSWHMDFIYQLGGVTRTDEELVVQFRNDEGVGQFIAEGLAVSKPLHLGEPIFIDDFRFLSGAVRTAMPKMTIPSPSMVLERSGTAVVDRTVYPDLDEFWADLATAFADEIRALADAGCRYLQLDDTSLACLNDPAQRQALAARGEDADHTLERNIRTINAAVADRPAGMYIAAHMCRGNFRSSWIAEGGYDYVAEEVFGGLDVDAFFCEFDDERSGDFAPLRFVPPGKQVVLGLVTTKRGRMEDADELKRRIDEAARYVPLDQLCLSPQCGFSSTVEGNVLNPYQEVDKLRLVTEVAHDVWGQL